MGRCIIDMPNERDWDATELWWVKVNVYQSGVLVMKASKGDDFVRVGKAWTTPENLRDHRPRFPETEIVDIHLV